MPVNASRLGVALVLAGVLVLFVGVIAQLTVTDGLAEVLWVIISVAGVVLIISGASALARRHRRLFPPED